MQPFDPRTESIAASTIEQLRQFCKDDASFERLAAILGGTSGAALFPALHTTQSDTTSLAGRLAFNQWLVQVIDTLLPDVIYLFNPETNRYLYVNQAIRRYGYDPAGILSGEVEMLQSHLHPEERAAILELHQEQLERMNMAAEETDAEMPFFDVQARMRCSDGSYRWVQDRRYVMERTQEGKVSVILGYLHDIQSLREAQELLDYHSSLEKATANVSRMFAQASVAEIDTTVQEALRQVGESSKSDRCYIFLSPQTSIEAAFNKTVKADIMRDAYSWSAPGISPIQIREIAPSGLRWAFDRLEQLRSIQIARMDTLPPEAVALREGLEAAGTKSLLVVPLHIEGRVIGLIGLSVVKQERVWSKEEVRMLRLVAETLVHAFDRKLSEEALRESEARFRTIFDRAPLAVSILNPQGQLIACNKQVERFLGYSEDEVRNRHFLDFVRPEDRDRSAELFYELLSGSIDSYTLELQYLHRDGSPIWTNVTASLVRDTSGKPAFVIRMLENIDERKAAQANMQHYTTLVSEQKSALERQSDMLLQLNGELMQKQKELEDLNSSKDKFFSIISHDLRSPFSSLLGITKLLAEGAGELERSDIQELAAALNTQANNVFDFMENLLKWAQAHTGRMKYQPTVLPLEEIVAPVEALFRENANAKGIVLNCEVSSALAVYADENMIRSVVQNLVSNALKFTPAGGSVTISAAQSTKKPKLVEISVSDTGVGMSKEDADKLFRIDVVHTTKGTEDETGSGLGLVLCKELVEKNGGTIRVESTEGSGTTFTFTLPLAKVV
jgi:PAS domain S-box-containing protein